MTDEEMKKQAEEWKKYFKLKEALEDNTLEVILEEVYQKYKRKIQDSSDNSEEE